jgi:hypothetical protein
LAKLATAFGVEVTASLKEEIEGLGFLRRGADTSRSGSGGDQVLARTKGGRTMTRELTQAPYHGPVEQSPAEIAEAGRQRDEYNRWVKIIGAGVFRGLTMWSFVAALIGFLLYLVEQAIRG